MKKFIILFLCIFYINVYSESDNNPGFISGYGLFAHYGLNVHKANFYRIPEVPTCCPKYDINANGYGLQAGFFFEFALPYNLAVGLRSSYNDLSADLKRNEFTYVKVNDIITKGTFSHHLNTTIGQLEFLPYISYTPIDFITITAGPTFGYYMQKKFDQYEKIESPSSGVFSDTHTKIRNRVQGDLPELNNTMVSLSGIIALNLPMNKQRSVLISPEIEFSYPLNTVINDLQWKIYGVKAGLALTYRPSEEQLQTITETKRIYKIDTLKIESRAIKMPKIAIGKEFVNTKSEKKNNIITINEITNRTDTMFLRQKPDAKINSTIQEIRVETQLVTQAFQNISVVFFDKNNSQLPSYYNILKNKDRYSSDKLESNAFILHKNILNIIGERMLKYPDAQINIVGTIDSTTEGDNCELAYQRGLTVKNYLQNIWKIDSSRIYVEKRDKECYPKNIAITKNDSAYAENRRVTITTTDKNLLAPIYRERFLEVLKVEPDTVALNTKGTSSEDIKEWVLTGTQGEDLIFKMEGKGQPEEIIKKKIDNDFAHRMLSDKKIEIGFGIIDSEGLRAGTSQVLNIRRDTSEYEVSRLSIILFDVASDKIPITAEKELDKFLNTADETTIIRIKGFSDILGTDEFNLNLSVRRAMHVAELCKRMAPKAEIESVKGVGSSEFASGISSYATCPERFFSRTVEIEVLKKLQKVVKS